MKKSKQGHEWNLELPEWKLENHDWNIDIPAWDIELLDWGICLNDLKGLSM